MLKKMLNKINRIEAAVCANKIEFSNIHNVSALKNYKNIDDIWRQVTELIRSELPEVSYMTWISPITLKGIKEGTTLALEVCNNFIREIIENI